MPFLRPVGLLLLISVFQFKLYAQVTNCPPNIDFETGTYSNWTFYTGTCCPISTNTLTTPITAAPSRHLLTSGTTTDIYGGFPIVQPVGGGNYALKLGNDKTGAQAERARYYVHVPANVSTYVLVFRYAVVLQDPQHGVAQQPRFAVSAYDSATGDLIPCSDVTYVASSTLPGFKLSTQGAQVYYKDWSTASIFLGNTVAGKTVAIDFATGDCAAGAHFGYAYVDMNCDILETYYDVRCSASSTVTLKAPPGYQKYQWMDSAMTKVISTNPSFIVGVPDSTTVFALMLTPFSGFGCQDTLFATVANLRVQATMDTSVCLDGGTGYIQLNAKAIGDSGPFIYNWFPTSGLSCTNCPNPVATVTSSIKYYVTITDTGGCTKMDSTLVTVEKEVEAKMGNVPDTICQYEPVEIQNIGLNPEGVVHYWDLDTGMILEGEGTALIKGAWNTPGLKKIKFRVSNVGCNKLDSTYIFIKPSPLAAFEIKHNVCMDEVINLYPKQQDNAKYQWTIDEQTLATGGYVESIPIAWTTLGKKKLHLEVVAENGCVSKYDTMVRVHGYPDGKIVANNSKDYCNGDTLIVATTPGDYYTYGWSPQEYFLGANTPEVKMLLNGDATVKLTVKSQWGCNTTDSLPVTTANCCKIVAPEAFSPNSDGKNDKFRIIPQGQNTIHTFIIMNRWGNVVHDAKTNTGWDGKFKEVPQDLGAYTYYVKYICNSGKIQEAKGSFLLVR
jgi:gliding motility-associated-like protein